MSEWVIASPPASTAADRSAALFHLRAVRELGWVTVGNEDET